MDALLTAEQLAEIRWRDAEEIGHYNRLAAMQAMPPVERWSVPASIDRRALLAHIDALQRVVNAASILERAMSGTDDEAGDDEMYALFEAVVAYRKQLGETK